MKMMVLDRFSGGNDPKGWILRAEQYFTYLGFSEQDWLPLPSFYLDGEALTWFTWLHRNKQFFNLRHFTEKLLMRFPQRTFTDSVSMPYSSQAYVDHVPYSTFAPPETFVFPIAAPSHVTNTSNLAVALTSRNSEAYHALEKLPATYTGVDSLGCITGSITEIAPLKGLETPQIKSAKSIEVDFVQKPSSLPKAQVFDEISQTVVSSCITDGHKFVTTVDKVFTANPQKSKQPSDATEVNSDSEDGNSEAAHMFDEMPNEVLEENSSVKPTSPNADGTSSDTIASLVCDNSSHNNDSALQCHYETLQTKVTVDNTIGVFSQFIPITSLMVSTGCNLIVNAPLDPTHEDKGNTGNKVAGVISISPLRDKIGYPIAFANQVSFMSLYLEFRLHKCNWVDTGQTHILLEYLLSHLCAYKNCNVLSFTRGGVTWLGRIMVSRTISSRALQHSTFVLLSDEADGSEPIGTELTISSQGKKIVTTLYFGNQFLETEVATPPTGRFNNQHNLRQFSFDPGVNFLMVPIPVTASNLCVWDPGISFEVMYLTGYSVDVEALQLWIHAGMFFLSAHTNSMPRVWDPGQSGCVNPYILQSRSALAPHFIHFYTAARGLSSYLLKLAPKANVLTWRRKFLILLLAFLDENKVRHLDMHSLEICMLMFIVSTSFGTLLFWNVDSVPAPTVKIQYSNVLDKQLYWRFGSLFLFLLGRFKTLAITLSTKPPVSTSSHVLPQLVFWVSSREKICITYPIQVLMLFTIGVGIFYIGANIDMLMRKSLMNDKMIVTWITFWTAGNYSLSIPWDSNLLHFNEDTLPIILVLITTSRIKYMVNLHKTLVALHSLWGWTKHLRVIFNQCSGLKNKVEHMWLHLSSEIVITLPFNGINAKKYVPLYENDTLLLLPLLYLNLEDKVLIEGGSIVVNGVGSVKAYGLELVNKTDVVKIVGPSKMLESFIWDLGPLSNGLKGTKSLKQGIMQNCREKCLGLSSPF